MRLSYLSAVMVIFCKLTSSFSFPLSLPEDATLYFAELSLKYGHAAHQYDVVTEDGYILSLYNLPGTKKLPVLLMHGMQGTSDTWILRGNGSLPITLANAGYDVWLGNCRGNRYSRRHRHLDPDRDSAFWNFTFHEHAIYDLRAIIDKVLDQTGAKKVNAIGHSLGNTIFFILGSIRPEYNEKINVLTALAPICYLTNISPLLSTIFKLTPVLATIINAFNIHELFGDLMNVPLMLICGIPGIGYKICIENLLFPFTGFDPEELTSDFYAIVNTHFPSSGSVKNFIHVAQLHNRNVFAQYDYGFEGNRLAYNASVAPEYELKRVSMPVAFIAGRNDRISALEDVKALGKRLPNVVSYVVSPHKQFNHLDDIWGEHMNVYLFPYIFKILEQYS